MSKDYAATASDEAIDRAKVALERNGFNVKIVNTPEDARAEVLSRIPKGSDVFTGTSATLSESGLDTELNDSGNYDSARQRYVPLMQEGKVLEAKQVGSASDYAVGSVHAITEDGEVVIASASGSQLPNYVYGANHVIWVAGAQKVVKDLSEAVHRLETHTLPLENIRAQKAYGAPSSIRKLLIYRNENKPGRITIVLIKQSIGY